MIISASRRTDIPAYYSDWFLRRLQAGEVMMPYPYNAEQIGKVKLSPENVDCIIFWTKNAEPIMDKLPQIEQMGYAFYFQFTVTPYDHTLERNLPPKQELINTFRQLSSQIGSDRVIWRYDPIIVDSMHSILWHTNHFEKLCRKLNSYTRKCIISFIDTEKSLSSHFRRLNHVEMIQIASGFSEIARRYHITLATCAQGIELQEYGIEHASCIDQNLVEHLTGYPIKARKDMNQRTACRCMESVDIGVYNTCINRCAYCYATSSDSQAMKKYRNHDPNAPMLTGYPTGSETITDRTRKSQKDPQLRLF